MQHSNSEQKRQAASDWQTDDSFVDASYVQYIKHEVYT